MPEKNRKVVKDHGVNSANGYPKRHASAGQGQSAFFVHYLLFRATFEGRSYCS
jgi:hypothetical protein